MINYMRSKGLLFFLGIILLLASCEKVNVEFGAAVSKTDPNIIYFDNYTVDVATFKYDSFRTNSNEVLAMGYHFDPVFGIVKAGSFAQISLPSTNSIGGAIVPVIYDSLELIIKRSGELYGDSSRLIKVNVYRLAENINNNAIGDYYYNTSSFNYYPTPIGQQTISLYGKSGTSIHIKLSDVLGQELFARFKNNNDEISTQEKFINYFKGIYINTDSVITNSLAYFSVPTDSALIRLTYHENGTYPEKKQLDFTYTKDRQFNNISFRHLNPNFSAFINGKEQVIPSSSSGDQSFLNSNLGSAIRITFPTLLNLKELYPYIKVVKATLVVKPDSASYSFPYQLPASLNLYSTDATNALGLGLYYTDYSSGLQTGDLFIDYLYGQNTNYSYDITSFINTKITGGQFSTSALLLYPSMGNLDAGIQRLIVNNTNNKHSIQLKLYVLGL